MAKKHLPHDRFFKHHMKNIQIATDFLTAHLPPWLQQLTDLKQLKSEAGEFVDENLRELITDKLFSAPIGGSKSYIYLLVEHRSKPDPIMVFRVYKYILRIMEPHLKQRKKSPNIFPFVFYNGKRPYNYSMDFAALFDNPSLARDLLFKEVQLINLRAIPDEALKQHAQASLFQLCMKHIHDDNIMPFIQQSMGLLQGLEQAGDKESLHSIVKYWLEAGKINDKMELIDTIKHGLSQQMGEEIMTTADFLRQEGWELGRQEGRQEGIQIGQEKLIMKLLQRGDSLAEIAKLTGLTVSRLEILQQQIKIN